MNVFFISDTHFNHTKIIDYCDRPFPSVEVMNDTMIRNWNNIVKKNDLIYHLGDFAMGGKKEVRDILSKLNGRKMLIAGNHDRWRPTVYMELGFEWATRFNVIYDNFFILAHEPAFLEWNSPYACLYGHLHQNSYIGPNNNYFNCCVEQINYTPIEFSEIKKRMKDAK